MRNILIFILCTANPVWGNLTDELSENEKNQLKTGIIFKTTPVEDSPWDAITLYTLIESTPLEAVAIFAAYDHQKNYVPKVLESTPVKHVTPTEVWCRYEYKMPWPISNSHYVHTHILKSTGKDSFRVEWKVVQSDAMDRVNGSADFIPFAGKTLLKYHSNVNPKSFLAFLFEKRMKRDVQETMATIVTHIEQIKKQNQPLLKKYVGYIKDALAGKNVYNTGI